MNDEHAFFVDSQWTWRDRLRSKLMPTQHCPLPELQKEPGKTTADPFGYGDVVHVDTIVGLSFLDRLRVLVTGHLMVRTRTVTEHVVGQSMTASVAYPIFKPAGTETP